jgi:hypothetical protein
LCVDWQALLAAQFQGRGVLGMNINSDNKPCLVTHRLVRARL